MKWILVGFMIGLVIIISMEVILLDRKLDALDSQIAINRNMTLVLKDQVQTLADAGLIGMTSQGAHRLLQQVKYGRRDSTTIRNLRGQLHARPE